VVGTTKVLFSSPCHLDSKSYHTKSRQSNLPPLNQNRIVKLEFPFIGIDLLEFDMLWQEINGTLHLVSDSQIICRVRIVVQTNRTICTYCQEIYQVAGLQLKELWQRKQAQIQKQEKQFSIEHTSSVKTVELKDTHLDSQSTIVNLGEWAEHRKKKSTTPQTSSFFAAQEQQDVTVG
jgi:hypothetical protein